LRPPSAKVISGNIEIAGQFHADLSRHAIQWNKIRGTVLSMIFQDAQLALNPMMTVREHFRDVLLFHKAASEQEITPLASELLRLLNFTDIDRVLASYPFQLSGGMCQRVCIALSLCLKPSVLIADEPTSALDSVSQKEVLDVLKNVQNELALSVLFITHDIAVANSVSERVIVLNKGIVAERGVTREVLSAPQTSYTRKLLEARESINEPFDIPPSNSEPVLEIIGLGKCYSKSQNVLSDLTLSLREREIVGVLGQSGCGKSTLAKCLTGVERPTSGTILFRGKDISMLYGKARREICRHIQIVFQDARASLNPRYTALQLVQEPMNYLHIGLSSERREKARFYLNQVGIDNNAQNRRPPRLSTGQCQRIAIARALILEPDILICDEAVSALDMQVQAQILSLLRQLHEQFRFSILMISHDIRVMRIFCHKIAVMKDGCFSEVGSADMITADSPNPSTRLLLACELSI
ncbi:MAG: ABC transporter ATP-binding protein, partial [Clostridiales bacterium]|nr:ABC transporter ATP-binding protein [Clostridiales bacterium]